MVIPTDCPSCRDAGMIDFHPYFALLCFQQDENANPILIFLHLFRIDQVIFLLCFCYLYCSKMVYYILFPWFANMRFKSSCLLVVTYSLPHSFKTVTSFVFDSILSSCLTFVIK